MNIELDNISVKNFAHPANGAITVTEGSTLTINSARFPVVFSGNKSNDLYVNASRVEIIADNNPVSFESGLTVENSGQIIKRGAAPLVLKGEVAIDGSLTVDEGDLSVVQIKSLEAKELIISTGTTLSTYGENKTDGVGITAGSLYLYGDWIMGVNLEEGYSDVIMAGDSYISGALIINTLGVGHMYVPIILSEGTMEGNFSNYPRPEPNGTGFSSRGAAIEKRDIDVIYAADGSVYLSIGIEHNIPFAATENQDQVWEIVGKKAQFDRIFKKAETMDNEKIKIMLDELSGVFTANALTLAARPNAVNSVLNRQPEKGVWTNGAFGKVNVDNPDNSLGAFDSSFGGIQAGAGILDNLGVFISYGNWGLSQGTASGSMSDIEAGIYSHNTISAVELKGALSGGIQSYEIHRNIEALKEKPESSFNTQSIRFAIEAAYNVVNAKHFKLRPFVLLSGGLANNGKIEEKDGGLSNLDIAAHSYTRVENRWGVEIARTERKVKWNVRPYVGFLTMGNEEKFDIAFSQDKESLMKIKTDKESPVFWGLGAGTDIDLSGKISVYGNISIETGAKGLGYLGSIGLRFRFAEPFYYKEEAEAARMAAWVAQIPEQQSEIIAKVEAVLSAGNEQVAQEIVRTTVEDRVKKDNVKGSRYMLGLFDEGSAALSEVDKTSIREIAGFIKQNDFVRIVIETHADGVEERGVALRLSQNRANSVLNEFVNNGIAPSKIEATGFGSRHSTPSADSTSGRGINRRVDIFVE
jgi:outer membrane protein OmpA-like peptidoglycan-associated protein